MVGGLVSVDPLAPPVRVKLQETTCGQIHPEQTSRSPSSVRWPCVQSCEVVCEDFRPGIKSENSIIQIKTEEFP
jgi:hypothetical protein